MNVIVKLAAALLAAGVASAASAAVVVDIVQVGADVLAKSSGSLNLTGLEDDGPGTIQDIGVRGNIGAVALGQLPFGPFDVYTGFTNATTFGSGAFIDADAGTGDGFVFLGSFGGRAFAYVPAGYVSGGALASTAIFYGTTIAALGLTPGQYVVASRLDSVTINIGNAVPEPASWALIIGGAGLVGGAMRRRGRAKMRVRFA